MVKVLGLRIVFIKMKDKRITISLTESQFEIWKQKAQEKEISLPEFIRRAVSVYITMLDRYNEKMQQKY